MKLFRDSFVELDLARVGRSVGRWVGLSTSNSHKIGLPIIPAQTCLLDKDVFVLVDVVLFKLRQFLDEELTRFKTILASEANPPKLI